MDELVNIPALLLVSDGETQFQGLSAFMVCALLITRFDPGKSGSPELSGWRETKPPAESIQMEKLPRKASRAKLTVTVL